MELAAIKMAITGFADVSTMSLMCPHIVSLPLRSKQRYWKAVGLCQGLEYCITLLISSPAKISEAAVIGAADDLTGQAVNAFVSLKPGKVADCGEFTKHVRTAIGAFAAPKTLFVVDDLPKTRSGKIMRRILRKIVSGEEDSIGDTSTVSSGLAHNATSADMPLAFGPKCGREAYFDSMRSAGKDGCIRMSCRCRGIVLSIRLTRT